MKVKFFYTIWIFGITLYSCSPFPVNDYLDDLGDGYTFVSESNANQFIYDTKDTAGQIAIPCTVEAIDYDKRYIIAKQRSNKDCFDNGLSTEPISFWIIDKMTRKTFGPLDSVRFSAKRVELSVPSSLDLK
jgi:hypothetical protein